MSRHFFRRAVLFAAILSLGAASHAAKPPKWVMSEDPAYPESTWLTGVGVGNDLDGARSNARAEISKVFQARVQQVMTDIQTESSSSKGKRRSAALGTQSSEMKTQVATDNVLEGVTVEKTWYDQKAKKYYALALLNKPNARRALAGQVTEKEEAIQGKLNQVKTAATPIEQARGYAQALRIAQERDALTTRQRVVDPSGMANLNVTQTSANLQNSLDEALAKIHFVLDADGGPDSRLKETVADRVTSLGFKIVDGAENATPQNPVLKLKCRLSVKPFDRGNPQWKFFLWEGTFEISEAGPSGKVLASSAPSGSDGHILEDAARKKTLASGEEGIAREAEQKISVYIFGE